MIQSSDFSISFLCHFYVIFISLPSSCIDIFHIIGFLQAVDIGGAMFIHAFGAYFGLGVSSMFYFKGEVEKKADKMESRYTSDVSSMIGKTLRNS